MVSEDDDLLVLGEYQGIRIVNTVTFLAILDHLTENTKESTKN